MGKSQREKGKVWATVRKHPAYEVSNHGDVRRRLPGRGTWAGRLLSPARDTKGYPIVCIHGRTTKIHGMVADAFIGPRPEGLQVNHIDGNKANNSVSNLEYVTGRENMRHAIRTGLMPPTPRGKANWHSGANRPRKLTEMKVRVIRRLIENGMRLVDIAPIFGIHQGTVSEIKRRRIWAWVA